MTFFLLVNGVVVLISLQVGRTLLVTATPVLLLVDLALEAIDLLARFGDDTAHELTVLGVNRACAVKRLVLREHSVDRCRLASLRVSLGRAQVHDLLLVHFDAVVDWRVIIRVNGRGLEVALHIVQTRHLPKVILREVCVDVARHKVIHRRRDALVKVPFKRRIRPHEDGFLVRLLSGVAAQETAVVKGDVSVGRHVGFWVNFITLARLLRRASHFFLLCISLLLLRQHREGDLERICGRSLLWDLVLGRGLDGGQKRLVHRGSLNSLLELGIRLLQIGLQVSHAIQSLHQSLGSGGSHCY